MSLMSITLEPFMFNMLRVFENEVKHRVAHWPGPQSNNLMLHHHWIP